MRAAAGQDERDGFRGRGIAEAARRGSTGPRARHRLLRPERRTSERKQQQRQRATLPGYREH